MIPKFIDEQLAKAEAKQLGKNWSALNSTILLAEILKELQKLNKNLEDKQDDKKEEKPKPTKRKAKKQ